MQKDINGAEFYKWMAPILDCLRQLGGSAQPKQVKEWIAQHLHVPEEKLEAKTKGGQQKRFPNQVAWARLYLVWEGLLDGSKRGEWKLTDLGAKTRLTEEDSRQLFLKWVEIHARARDQRDEQKKEAAVIEPSNESTEDIDEADEAELLGVIQGLPPDGFERLCKRVLHEWRFQEIRVLGKSHDGGVDGVAVLRLNPFVSFDVAFQCKRYRGAVSREQVASFRGSKKAQHADKLIFITTGYFTSEAIKEAKGEGATAVELVDGEQLVSLFKEKQLGLRREEVFKIDHAFFDQFRQVSDISSN